MKLLLFLPVVLALPIIRAAEPTVTLAGVQVVMDDGGEDFDGFKTFNMEKGHKVALIVRNKDKAMVGFDEDKASITLGGAKTECHFFSNMAFSKDRHSLKLEFHTSDPVQMEKDGVFKVAGGLPLVLATGKKETRSEVFAAKEGTAIVFPKDAEGMPVLKVKSAGKPKFGDDGFEIEISTNRKIDEFAGFRFYTKDGEPVEADQSGSSWMGFGNKGSGEVFFSFKASHTDLILAVENWSGREEVTVKVDLSAGAAVPSR